MGLSVLIIYGERLSPVALAAEDGVAQAEVHLYAAQVVLCDKFLGGGDGFSHAQAVQAEAVECLYAFARAVHHRAFLGIKTLLAHVGPFDQGNDGQVEMACKGVVARVVCGHGHDGSRSVTGEYVVGHPDGYGIARERVDGIRTCEHARNAAVGDALALGAFLGGFEIGFHLGTLSFGGQTGHQLAFRCENHEGYAENGICARGKDGKFHIAVLHGKLHLGSFGASNPVALRFLE